MKEFIKIKRLEQRGKVGTILFHRNEKIAVLGKYNGTVFDGGDQLSMAVMKDLDGLLKLPYSIVAEGDRFTNKTFIEKADPIIIKIMDDGSKGRAKRGSNQTERQIKSIATRVRNIDADYEVPNSSAALKLLLGFFV